MKSLILFIVTLFFGVVSYAQTNLEVVEFDSKLKVESKALLVDVRQDWEVKNGFISGAINHDFMDDDFILKFKNVSKDTPIYLYCASGGRSGEAAEILSKAGYKKVYNLLGGMRAWNAAGKPVVKP